MKRGSYNSLWLTRFGSLEINLCHKQVKKDGQVIGKKVH